MDQTVEFESRLKAAWGKFYEVWPLLRRRGCDIGRRLRLFDSTVGGSALWCAESWVLTKKQKSLLRSTFRTMLRRSAGPRRMSAETYIDWVKRATRRIETLVHDHNIEDWVNKHLRLKWGWAGHVVRMDHRRWARRTLLWKGEDSFTTAAMRPHVGRPRLRWEDDSARFAKLTGWASWTTYARNCITGDWNAHSAEFVRFFFNVE